MFTLSKLINPNSPIKMLSKEIQELTQYFPPKKILSDGPSLTAYAIDASIYKVLPRAVVLAENSADIKNAVHYSKATSVPITARSGGTNLTGNAIGPGIILEFSRINRILEINKEELWARVQPGIVYAELSQQLSKKGLMFAPDPSSGDMCKLGGMMGNNAAGPHSLKYGATKDNVLELEIILASGKTITAKPYLLNSSSCRELLQHHREFRDLLALVQQNAELINRKKRQVSKNSSGYNLFALAEGLEQGIFDLPRLFIGSEGTLALTTEAKIKLVSKPRRVVTSLIYFQKLEQIGKAVNELLTLEPSALEMMDSNAMDLVGRKAFGIPNETQVLLLMEFDHENLDGKLAEAKEICQGYSLCGPMEIAFEKEKQDKLWEVRKAIYPTLYRYDQAKKPINFADDVVVPVKRLSDLIRYLDGYFKKIGVPVAIYGHIGNGNAHINPLLNVNHPDDFQKMLAISKEIHQTVINRYEGSICGEHGDGRVRAEFVKDLYGEEMYRLFKITKKILDPQNILNPGVKITDTPFTQNIDFHRLSKPCATCAKCSSVCPVYDVLQEESNSARGWFHILTDPHYSYEESKRVVESCINCKSCREVCPAGIDVSALVLEKREESPHWITEGLAFFQSKPKIFIPLVKLAGRTQPVWDRFLGRWILEKMSRLVLHSLNKKARIPREMVLPKLVTQTLREQFNHLTEGSGHTHPLAYFHGCAANLFQDGVGEALLKVLHHHGISPVLPAQRCSGTPIQTYGHKKILLDLARFNLESLSRFDRVITSCASCTLMLKDYPTLFTHPEPSKRN